MRSIIAVAMILCVVFAYSGFAFAEDETSHTHTDSCYGTTVDYDNLICGKDIHTHSEKCANSCGMVEHVHMQNSCQLADGVSYADLDLKFWIKTAQGKNESYFKCGTPTHLHGISCSKVECKIDEHAAHDDSCYGTKVDYDNLICELDETPEEPAPLTFTISGADTVKVGDTITLTLAGELEDGWTITWSANPGNVSFENEGNPVNVKGGTAGESVVITASISDENAAPIGSATKTISVTGDDESGEGQGGNENSGQGEVNPNPTPGGNTDPTNPTDPTEPTDPTDPADPEGGGDVIDEDLPVIDDMFGGTGIKTEHDPKPEPPATDDTPAANGGGTTVNTNTGDMFFTLGGTAPVVTADEKEAKVEEQPAGEVMIEDEDTPLANIDLGEEESNGFPWWIIAVAVVVLGGLFFIIGKRRREEEN